MRNSPDTRVLTIAEKVSAVRAQMAEACVRAGRPVEAVTLIAVSKTHPAASILSAVVAGVQHFGENRIEEADKIAAVTLSASNRALTWHMIGHVQSRKAREVVEHFGWIHSLDSVKLAERYARLAVESAQPLNVLLEINISGEASKEGLPADKWREDTEQRRALWDVVRQIVALSHDHFVLRGLMTVAPIAENAEQVRPVFAALRRLRDALTADFPQADWRALSMGMTDDYPVAIEEGATLVRVGRAIFGPRSVLI